MHTYFDVPYTAERAAYRSHKKPPPPFRYHSPRTPYKKTHGVVLSSTSNLDDWLITRSCQIPQPLDFAAFHHGAPESTKMRDTGGVQGTHSITTMDTNSSNEGDDQLQDGGVFTQPFRHLLGSRTASFSSYSGGPNPNPKPLDIQILKRSGTTAH